MCCVGSFTSKLLLFIKEHAGKKFTILSNKLLGHLFINKFIFYTLFTHIGCWVGNRFKNEIRCRDQYLLYRRCMMSKV